MLIFNNVSELVGSTPIMKLDDGLYAKLAFLNPTGSVKDRAALYMIEDAEQNGPVTQSLNLQAEIRV